MGGIQFPSPSRLKVDQRGDVYVSGPGGIWILSPQEKHIGTVQAPELPANFAWVTTTGRPFT